MHLILTGATGLVGTAVLYHILSLPPSSPVAQQITRLSIISRRPQIPLLEHPQKPRQNTFTKIEVLTHKDFGNYEQGGLLSKLKDSVNDNEKIGVIWALGISQMLTKSEAEYDEITRQYPLEAAKEFSEKLGAKQVNFVYVSGEGATPKPGLFTQMFGRIKGRTETELIKLMESQGCLKIYNARPGGVDAGADKDQKVVEELTNAVDGGTGGQTRSGMGMVVASAVLLPVLRKGVYKGMHSPTEELSKVLVELAVGDGEPVHVKGVEANGRTLPNVVLRRLGGAMKL